MCQSPTLSHVSNKLTRYKNTFTPSIILMTQWSSAQAARPGKRAKSSEKIANRLTNEQTVSCRLK